jgi:hypothetical protein
MTPDTPTGRTLVGDVEHAVKIAGLGGIALTFLIFGAPAGIASILGAEGAPDRLGVFVRVLLFTLPLSGGIFVWALGFMHIRETWQGTGPLLWSVFVAAGALIASATLGGAAISRQFEATAGSVSGPLELPIRVLLAFLNAYGQVVFAAALVCGGILVTIYAQTVYPRLKA